jgi:hypothetical protein
MPIERDCENRFRVHLVDKNFQVPLEMYEKLRKVHFFLAATARNSERHFYAELTGEKMDQDNNTLVTPADREAERFALELKRYFALQTILRKNV